MMPIPLDIIPGIVVSGYESLVGTFGSPAVLMAISIALIATAVVQLRFRCAKPAEGF
jgi:hypothetical protein